MKRASWFWKCFASRACLIRWRSTALSSIFVEMNPRPKSMMYSLSLDRIVLDVVRSPWIMLFLWRRAVCSPSCCMTLNCFFSG